MICQLMSYKTSLLYTLVACPCSHRAMQVILCGSRIRSSPYIVLSGTNSHTALILGSMQTLLTAYYLQDIKRPHKSIGINFNYSRRVHNSEPMGLYLLPMSGHALLLCHRSQHYIHGTSTMYLRALLIRLL